MGPPSVGFDVSCPSSLIKVCIQPNLAVRITQRVSLVWVEHLSGKSFILYHESKSFAIMS